MHRILKSMLSSRIIEIHNFLFMWYAGKHLFSFNKHSLVIGLHFKFMMYTDSLASGINTDFLLS